MCDKMNKPVWAIIQGVYQKVGHNVDDDDEVGGEGDVGGNGDHH